MTSAAITSSQGLLTCSASCFKTPVSSSRVVSRLQVVLPAHIHGSSDTKSCVGFVMLNKPLTKSGGVHEIRRVGLGADRFSPEVTLPAVIGPPRRCETRRQA